VATTAICEHLSPHLTSPHLMSPSLPCGLLVASAMNYSGVGSHTDIKHVAATQTDMHAWTCTYRRHMSTVNCLTSTTTVLMTTCHQYCVHQSTSVEIETNRQFELTLAYARFHDGLERTHRVWTRVRVTGPADGCNEYRSRDWTAFLCKHTFKKILKIHPLPKPPCYDARLSS